MQNEKLADLHVHTAASPDVLHNSKHTLEEALAEASLKGLTAIAITEHGPVLHDYDKSQGIADREGVILVPGVELRAIIEDGRTAKIITRLFGRKRATVDVLAYGVTDEIPEATLSLHQLIEKIHKQNGLAIIAHPSFAPAVNWYGPLGRRLIKETGADGIESFNAAVLAGMNENAQKLAIDLELPVTGGSDTRTLENIGKGVTVFNRDTMLKDWQDVLDAIKSGKTISRGTSRKFGLSFAQ